MKITPLEEWIRRKIGHTHGPLTRQAIQGYQLHKLIETVSRAQEASPFYRRLLGHIKTDRLSDISDIACLPFTTTDDLRENPQSFLCVHPDRIARVVTLPTSGTAGKPKRVFFTEKDQELTIDFFHHGMEAVVALGEKVLILMTGDRPGSIGDLLKKGLDRLGVQGILHGPVENAGRAVERAVEEDVQCIVGIPVQVYAMVQYQQAHEISLTLRSVLLSTDRIPPVIAHHLKQVWQCNVFNHYGMTEMGLGGGVECEALAGYHIREADLLIEIVDPETGESLRDGESGEIVFTTLTREGMPLIRYRTGDISRFIPAPCPCGTVLKRLEPVFERMSGKITLYSGDILTIGDLDDALFPLCGILDFTAAVSYEKGKDRLYVTCRMAGPCEDSGGSMRIIEALRTIPAVGAAEDSGNLKVCADIIHCDAPWPHSRGTAKRTIDKMRMNGSF